MEKTDGSANKRYGSLWRADGSAEGDKPGDVDELRSGSQLAEDVL